MMIISHIILIISLIIVTLRTILCPFHLSGRGWGTHAAFIVIIRIRYWNALLQSRTSDFNILRASGIFLVVCVCDYKTEVCNIQRPEHDWKLTNVDKQLIFVMIIIIHYYTLQMNTNSHLFPPVAVIIGVLPRFAWLLSMAVFLVCSNIAMKSNFFAFFSPKM